MAGARARAAARLGAVSPRLAQPAPHRPAGRRASGEAARAAASAGSGTASRPGRRAGRPRRRPAAACRARGAPGPARPASAHSGSSSWRTRLRRCRGSSLDGSRDRVQAHGRAHGPGLGPPQPEQRVARARAHGGQAVEPGAAQQVDQHRLGLVVHGVAGGHVRGAGRRSGRPGPAPRGWGPSADRRPARPGTARRTRRAAAATTSASSAEPGPQPVVDVDGRRPARRPPRRPAPRGRGSRARPRRRTPPAAPGAAKVQRARTSATAGGQRSAVGAATLGRALTRRRPGGDPTRRTHAAGLRISAREGSHSGPRQTRSNRSDPPACSTAWTNPRPRRTGAAWPRARGSAGGAWPGPCTCLRRSRSTRAEPRRPGHRRRAGPVHGHVAVALEQAHERLDALERLELLGGGHQAEHAGVVERAAPGPDLLGGPAHGVGQPPRVGGHRLEPLVDQRHEVVAQPGHGGELAAVGHLVEGQPEAELAGREAVALLEGHHVGAHVVDEVLVLGGVLGEQQVVLAEHPGRHPGQHQAELGPAERPGRPRPAGRGSQARPGRRSTRRPSAAPPP